MEYRHVRSENTKLNRQIAFYEKRKQTHLKKFNEIGEYEKNLRRRYDLKEIPNDVRLAGSGGTPSLEERLLLSQYSPSLRKAFNLENTISELKRQIALEDTLLRETDECIAMQQKRMRQIPIFRPTDGYIASHFGWRADPMGGEDKCFHEGLDFANKIGTPVYTTADGVVRFTGVQGSLGRVVRILHEDTGYKTVYGHLESSVVQRNQKIQRGDLIGYMGNSGRSTGPHLHYEVRKSGAPLNPEELILPDSIMVD